MPHDRNGKPLHIGDNVIIRGVVNSIQPLEEYCNVEITLNPMPPNTTPYKLNLNTKQVEYTPYEVLDVSPKSE